MDLTQLSMRICYDYIPDGLSEDNTSIYCFAHNNINIPIIANAVKNIPYSKFILENKDFMSGVSSYRDTNLLYKSLGVDVEPIEYDNTWINTKIEADVVVEWARKQNIKNLIICAPVFHMVRAYMTTVSIILSRNLNIRVYAVAGKIDDWKKITITHQGLNKASFNDFIIVEIERIVKYQEKGDILETDRIWEYITQL